MAALGAQSIASSYEQLLHVDRDGGGNSTTHVAIKDGDNGTTFGFTIASDALMMSSTNRLEFGDTGTYIHQSADGVLDLVSDTEIEINATTIDINGAVAMDGAMTGGTNITISGELDAATLDISGNADIAGTTNLDAVDIDGNVQLDGTFTIGTDGSGQDVTFYSGTSGDSFVWDSSEEKLTITGTNGQTALDIADGNLVVADNIDLEGDIDVNGTANLDAVDIDGSVQIDNTVTVGADDTGYDVIFYGDTASSNMTWDTSGDDLILNDARLFIDQDDNDYALYIEAQNTTSSAFEIISDALTTGKIAQFYSNSSDTNTRSLVRAFNDNALATGTTGLEVRQDAAQKAVFIDQNADGIGIDIDTEATTKAAIRIIDPKTTTGKAVQIDECDGLTTGSALYVHSNSADNSNRNLVSIINDHASADNTRALYIQNDGALYGIEMAGGCGIRFDNTVASTDAHTLDDYEEGNITPTLLGSSSNPTQIYNSRGGFYTKIGNRVFYTIRLEMNGSGISAGSGNLIIGGLPFTVKNDINNYGAVSVGVTGTFGTGQHGAPTTGYHSANETLLRLQVYDNDGGNISGVSDADAADITNGTTITVSGHYII
tara:strand:+ start:25178 stop:26986 length:1809 start_codon:yes stop_codon:yes gene_type:complete